MKSRWSSILFLLGFWTACASGPKFQTKLSPQDLFMKACFLGKHLTLAQGRAWLKIKSPEISGQFSAQLRAFSEGKLELEVTHFLGGTVALILVQEDLYTFIQGSGETKEVRQGRSLWGGVPLKWVSDLFLGKIPCPPLGVSYQLSISFQGDLVVDTEEKESQRFIYSFQEKSGKPWPRSLHWEKKTQPLGSLDFNFDDSESDTLSPLKWEVRSQDIFMKVHWRTRKISFN